MSNGIKLRKKAKDTSRNNTLSKSQSVSQFSVYSLNLSYSSLERLPPLDRYPYLQYLNLKGNCIASFEGLKICSSTQSTLKSVDLSTNLIESTQTLRVLALQCPLLISLWLNDNPICNELNLAFSMMAMFPRLRLLYLESDEREIRIRQQTRLKACEWQLTMGDLLEKMLNKIIKMITKMERHQDKHQIAAFQKAFQQIAWLSSDFNTKLKNQDLVSMNAHLHQFLKRFIAIFSHQTQEIFETSHFSISPHQNCKTHQEQQEIGGFYCKWMIKQEQIMKKLLIIVQDEEEDQTTVIQGCLEYLQQKFKEQLVLINRMTNCRSVQSTDRSLINSISPFKSLQTDITERRQSMLSAFNFPYFSMDYEWVNATIKFVIKRIQSLQNKIKIYIQVLKQMQIYSNENEQHRNNIQDSPPIQNVKYNKYVMGGCLRILQKTFLRYYFNKLLQYCPPNPQNTISLVAAIGNPVYSKMVSSFEHFLAYSLHLQRIFQKIKQFRLKSIVKAWRGIKHKKYQLLKRIMKRQERKEKAFMSITFTQWRLAISHSKIKQHLHQNRQEISNIANLSIQSAIQLKHHKSSNMPSLNALRIQKSYLNAVKVQQKRRKASHQMSQTYLRSHNFD